MSDPTGYFSDSEDTVSVLRSRVQDLEAQLAAAEQEKEKVWQMYERARKERADVLMLKSVEGLTMSEWQLRLAKAQSELRTLRRTSVRVDVLLRYNSLSRKWHGQGYPMSIRLRRCLISRRRHGQ